MYFIPREKTSPTPSDFICVDIGCENSLKPTSTKRNYEGVLG
jgi:hypothetical protein